MHYKDCYDDDDDVTIDTAYDDADDASDALNTILCFTTNGLTQKKHCHYY